MVDLELCRNEIETLRLCQHPNIIRIHDVLENSEHLFIALELLNGHNLQERIVKNGKSFTEDRIARIILKLTNALAYMHEIGIVHRDIKPENILFVDDTEDSNVKIADFGLAIMLGPKQTCKGFAGTIQYASPEILLGFPYDKSVDIWNLGMLTYMLLSGKLPIKLEDSIEVTKSRILNENFDMHTGKWADVSLEAKDFVNSKMTIIKYLIELLAKNPKKRMTEDQIRSHPWIKLHCKI